MNEKNVGPKRLAFVADTQAPMWIEGVFLRGDNNIAATKLIMQNIIDSSPETLFMLGDVVSLGFSSRAWNVINVFLKELKERKIPVFGILGNHELMQRPLKGQGTFQKYFPDHVSTGYCEVVDSIAVMLMNSNFSSMNTNDIVKQNEWYTKKMDDLEKDKKVKVIIVTCHHPPFTNSKLVKSSKPVQSQFLPAYLKSKKSKLFITGHAHLFEHYKYEGKDFLVIGGGGGLRHPMMSNKIELPDEASNYKPRFHYLTVEISADSLLVISHKLKSDFSGIEEGLRFTLPLDNDPAEVRQAKNDSDIIKSGN